MLPQVCTALNTLTAHGFEAYLVGGCVRDILLEQTPNDWDITTSALPDEVQSAFSTFKMVETGLKHGTVMVVVDGLPLEITTYRVDGEYLDNRHPSEVSFSRSLRDDVWRRDFTMNAICLDMCGNVVDYCGGAGDIKARIIRCVGVPNERFREDALRILRALRFAAVLGFDVDEQTRCAIHENRGLLQSVSCERIMIELSKLVCGKKATDVLTEYGDVMDAVKTLVSGHMASITATKKAVRRLLARYGQDALKLLLEFEPTGNAQRMFEEIMREAQSFSVKDLAVNGDDLLGLGFEGKQIGDALNVLCVAVEQGKVANNRDELLAELVL